MVKIILDSYQILIAKKLHQLGFDLEIKSSSGFFKKIISSKNQLKSLYIYGDVGCGKSMLMKDFFASLSKTPKIYFHFNSFIKAIHEALRDVRKEQKKFKDELIEALKRVIKKNQLLCLDEFQVLDIADAMILERIFSYLFSKNILVVFTSNSHPQELYKNGLQREVFLNFINQVLLKNCEILHLDSSIDYRRQYSKNLAKRYFISNQKNRAELKEIIKNLTGDKKLQSHILKVWGRDLKIKKTFDKIAIFNFDELCRNNLAAADYQAICQNFDLIFLLKLPKLMSEDVNEARRFVLFIDEIYENQVALIILAKTNPEKIYENGVGIEAFKRTISRLNEIKSDQYWQASKRIRPKKL